MGMQDIFNINELILNDSVNPKKYIEEDFEIKKLSSAEKHCKSERKRRKELIDNYDRMKSLLNLENETKQNTLKLMYDEIIKLKEIKANIIKEKEKLKESNKR